jgi:hypothetical protein
MAAKRERVGGHVGRKRAAQALGFEPEVGETFEAEGLRLRVLSRTIGLETGENGEEEWFDLFFVATVEPVDDVEATAERLRELFGLELEDVDDEDDEHGAGGESDDEPRPSSEGDGDALAAVGDEAEDKADGERAKPVLRLDDAVLRDLKDILEAA